MHITIDAGTGTPDPGAGRPARKRTARKRVAQSLSALVTAAVALATVTVADGQAAPLPSGAGTPPSSAEQETGMTSGLPLADPPEADTAPSSDLRITLDVADTRFDLAGRQVRGQSYNGSFVAPTLRFAPGEQATITVVNHLRVATNLHFHGLHVSPSNNSDNSSVCIAPGETFVYQLAIPADHPIGTFWYHSHAMSRTCPAAGGHGSSTGGHGAVAGGGNGSGFVVGDQENQIFAGLSGAIVVGDIRTLLPAGLKNVTAHTLILKDVQIDGSGRILQNTDTTKIDSNNPTVRLVNGQLRPVLDIRPGQTQLWRLANAGADIYYRLQLDGHRFTVIGEDGRPAARTTTHDALVLPPGKRYDVLVTAADSPRSTVLRTTALSTGPQGDSYPDVPVAEVRISGEPDGPRPTVPTAMPTAPPDLAGAPVSRRRTLVLSENHEGLFTINGRPFSMDTSIFTTPATLDTVEEWTIVNESGEDHPFHLHTDAFQVMSVDGVAQPYTGRQDVALVPRPVDYSRPPGQIVVRIRFADYPGRWTFHCHIASHEDNGMMSFIDVAPAKDLPLTL